MATKTTKILYKRGLESQLPILSAAEIGYTTDTKKLFVGSGSGNIAIANNNSLEAIATEVKEVKNTANEAMTEMISLKEKIIETAQELNISLEGNDSALDILSKIPSETISTGSVIDITSLKPDISSDIISHEITSVLDKKLPLSGTNQYVLIDAVVHNNLCIGVFQINQASSYNIYAIDKDTYEIKWTISSVSSIPTISVGEDGYFYYSAYSDFSKIDMKTGSRVYKMTAQTGLSSVTSMTSICADKEGYIYTSADSSGVLFKLDSSGKVIWSSKENGRSKTIVKDGHLVTCADSRFYSVIRTLDSLTGEKINDASYGKQVASIVVRDDKAIVIGAKGDDQLVMCVSIKTGNSIWQINMTEPYVYNNSTSYYFISAVSEIIDGAIYFLIGSSILTKVELATGQVIYRSYPFPAVTGGVKKAIFKRDDRIVTLSSGQGVVHLEELNDAIAFKRYIYSK